MKGQLILISISEMLLGNFERLFNRIVGELVVFHHLPPPRTLASIGLQSNPTSCPLVQ